jgi:hypothetical protein
VTLEDSTTYVSFTSSPDEASWWRSELAGMPPGGDPSLFVQEGRALVAYGMTSTPEERAAIEACL